MSASAATFAIDLAFLLRRCGCGSKRSPGTCLGQLDIPTLAAVQWMLVSTVEAVHAGKSFPKIPVTG